MASDEEKARKAQAKAEKRLAKLLTSRRKRERATRRLIKELKKKKGQ